MKSTLHSRPRSAVDTVLLEHPDVADSLLIDEQAPDGRTHKVAYVMPRTERIRMARSSVNSADRDRRIRLWRSAFDQTYRLRDEDHAPSFVGWKSCYANQAIPEPEMQEWLARTIERVGALRPKRVLEIGCGVGLILQALAPSCLAYRGTDLSPVAIDRLRRFVATRPDLAHVELSEREATCFDDVVPGSADLVILNSVVQYFPDLEYLRTVLEHAARATAAGGHIFIGDVRHLGLLPAFHGSVQLAKAPVEASAGWLKRKVLLAVEQERELVIDPRFFFALSESIPRVTGVEILLKRGSNNELTRYRYDVLLHVEAAASSADQAQTMWDGGHEGAAELLARFKAQQLPAVRIFNVPNRRIARDLEAVRLLETADHESVGSLKKRLEEFDDRGIDPEEFWKISDSPTYDVRVGCSHQARHACFDVALVERGRHSAASMLGRASRPRSDEPLAALATDPFRAAFMQQLGLDLRKMLQGRLPEPLLPAAVLAVNDLPVR